MSGVASDIKKMAASTDLSAKVYQSACDKLIGSVSYPFVVAERHQDFPGCSNMERLLDRGGYKYSSGEIEKFFKNSIKPGQRMNLELNDRVFSFGGSIIEQAKRALDASTSKDYTGPSRSELQSVVDGGIENLVTTFGDFDAYAWCPHLRVTLTTRPSIKLSSPRIDLNGIKINVEATGELWVKYPWPNCYKWCTQWKKVIKCDRIASVTVSVDLKAEAHANVMAKGTEIIARGEFDRLRLDYDILDKIALEGIANRALGDRLLAVYDASQLVATVPLLKSRFAIGSVSLPASADGIGVEISVKQI